MIDPNSQPLSSAFGIQRFSPRETRPTAPLTEASGWYHNAQGQVVLGSPRRIPPTVNTTCDWVAPPVSPASHRSPLHPHP